MKKINLLFILFLLSVFGIAISAKNISGNPNLPNGSQTVPKNLLELYDRACDLGNEEQKLLINTEIEKYLDKKDGIPCDWDFTLIEHKNELIHNDWYSNDILVTNSDVAVPGTIGQYKQMDLKQGEDGVMYLAVNRRNVNSNNGYISVYRSFNGGASWEALVSNLSQTYFFGSISMLVESRDNSNPDSTRILVYFTTSSSSNMDNAVLRCWSFRTNTNSFASYTNIISIPPAGNRYVFPTACSDGMYFQGSTFMHCIVREETNAGLYVAFQHFRSTDWGANHTVSTITSYSGDNFPSAAYSAKTGADSIYIAIERAVWADEVEIRVLTATSVPSGNFGISNITDATSGIVYRKPCITIQQRNINLPQNMMITCTRNNRAVYHYSINGGSSWVADFNLGLPSQLVNYTYCSSDSLTDGSGYFLACAVDSDGDSILTRRGVLNNMGVISHKRNSNPGTGSISPVCAIYRNGNSKYSAFTYAGSGPSNVYYNMESLITGIEPVSNEIPSGFKLEQNYPNPFNPVTNIKFSVTKTGFVSLTVYDITGKETSQFVNKNLNPGTYNYEFDASMLPSGVYFYRLNTDGFTDVKKMILVK